LPLVLNRKWCTWNNENQLHAPRRVSRKALGNLISGAHTQGTFVAVFVLLIATAGLSAAPLFASKEGWLHFYQDDMETTYLRNLNLEPWDHFIHVGYYKVLIFLLLA